jgi:hypothetical protein
MGRGLTPLSSWKRASHAASDRRASWLGAKAVESRRQARIRARVRKSEPLARTPSITAYIGPPKRLPSRFQNPYWWVQEKKNRADSRFG